MADYIAKEMQFIGANGIYAEFIEGHTYLIRYRKTRDGVYVLLGIRRPDDETLLMTHTEFEHAFKPVT